MTDALTFLKTRRSRPAKILTAPVPDRDALEALLCVAARTPDHGKLEPWRFIVLEQAALRRLGALARNLAEAAVSEVVDADKASQQFGTGQLAVVVVASPKPCDKFPQIELVVQSSEYRCFTDEEYMLSGTDIVNDVSDCDILFGVKEVPLELLLYGKTYFFFSHTIKMQPYNRIYFLVC